MAFVLFFMPTEAHLLDEGLAISKSPTNSSKIGSRNAGSG